MCDNVILQTHRLEIIYWKWREIFKHEAEEDLSRGKKKARKKLINSASPFFRDLKTLCPLY